MEKALSRAYKNFSKDFDLPAFSAPDRASPEFDVKDNVSSYVVSAEIPGMKLDDFRLMVRGNQITIYSDGDPSDDEVVYGRISQGITFVDHINTDAIEKTYENGKLRIEIPKVAKQFSQ